MKRFPLVVLVCGAFASLGFGQDSFGPTKGGSLLSLSGAYAYTSYDDGSSDQQRLTLGSALGYFLTDEHEVGGALHVDIFNDDDLGSPELMDIGPYYNYNYRSNPRTWFYGGVHAGYLYLDLDSQSPDHAFTYGAQIGLRHWLTPTTSVFFEPRYTHIGEVIGSEREEFQTMFGLSVTL